MSEWREVTLGELVAESEGSIQTGPFGSQLHAEDYVAQGTPSVMPANIGDNVIDPTGIAQVGPDEVRRLARHQLVPGDIVYSRRGDVERRAYVREANAGWLCGTGCLRVRFGPMGEVDPQYVSYALGAPWTREWIRQNAVGATMLNLNTKILGGVPLAVPSLAEQHAIAEVLGALDDKIEANRKLAATADALARVRFRAMYDAGSRMIALSDVARFVNGRAFTKDATGTGRVVVRIAELNSGISASTVRNDLDVADEHVARPGDLLFAWSGSLTLARWYRPEAIVNQHIFKVIPRDGYPMWLVNQLILEKLREFQAVAADKATTMGHIQRRHLDEPVRVPGRSTLEAGDRSMDALWNRALLAERENETLATLRDTLLPKLMSGQLRVEEAAEMAGL